MNFKYNDILHIPKRAILDVKLTKAFFYKHFSLTASEKRILKNTIVEMQLLANLKAENVNIPKIINEEYIYDEIQIIICNIGVENFETNANKCITLIQKHIPYQCLIIIENDTEFLINACDKRINQKEKDKRTIINYSTTPTISKLYKNEITDLFFKAINFAYIDKTNMETTYKSYVGAIVQMQTSKITGNFLKRHTIRTEEDMINLKSIEEIEKEITILANQIKKETQLNNRVGLNIKIQEKRKEIKELKNKLN